MDAALPQLITAIFLSPTFTAVDGAFVASLYGCLNLFFRPMGGVIADLLYKKYGPGLGLKVKVWYLLVCAFSQGITLIGLGFYINNNPTTVTLGGVCGFIVAIAFFGFQANAGECVVVSKVVGDRTLTKVTLSAPLSLPFSRCLCCIRSPQT